VAKKFNVNLLSRLMNAWALLREFKILGVYMLIFLNIPFLLLQFLIWKKKEEISFFKSW
jgi:hypothetical protein